MTASRQPCCPLLERAKYTVGISCLLSTFTLFYAVAQKAKNDAECYAFCDFLDELSPGVIAVLDHLFMRNKQSRCMLQMHFDLLKNRATPSSPLMVTLADSVGGSMRAIRHTLRN